VSASSTQAPAVAPVTLDHPTVGTFPAVSSSQARGTAACVATPRSMRVAAHEQSIVQVTVRNNGVLIRDAAVRVTLPGGSTVVHRTNRNGVATFTLRPPHSGNLVVQADTCFGARRIAVKAARVSGRRQVSPAFTG
jgi:hypothetical protein